MWILGSKILGGGSWMLRACGEGVVVRHKVEGGVFAGGRDIASVDGRRWMVWDATSQALTEGMIEYGLDLCWAGFMIGIMNKVSTTFVLGALVWLATPALGQVAHPGGTIPPIQDPNPAYIPWAIAILFAIGTVSISMKPSKRNRL